MLIVYIIHYFVVEFSLTNFFFCSIFLVAGVNNILIIKSLKLGKIGVFISLVNAYYRLVCYVCILPYETM